LYDKDDLKENMMVKKKEAYRAIRISLMLFILLMGFAAIYVVRSATGIVQSHGWLASGLHIDMLPQEGIIVGGILMEEVLLWCGIWLVNRMPILLFVLQLGFGISTSGSLSAQMPILLMGVIAAVAIEVITLYPQPRIGLISLGVAVLIMWAVYTIYNGWFQGIMVGQSLFFIVFLVLFYWRYYMRQQEQRQRAEELVAELQIAYAQVEESTIRTERQRVARELHDTLTQGLAGTVMQLEAAQSFLQQGNVDRASTIVAGATDIARETLRDSRLTLTDLRATTEKSLTARLELLADAFHKNYQMATKINLKYVPDYSDEQLTEITRIVSEAMINVVKHTDTRQVVISGETTNDVFSLRVIDFGSGTPVKRRGHFGMQGMHERAATLNGALTVVGTPGEGTTVTLTIPTKKQSVLSTGKEDTV
jgi:NarL family two-component system sensor histidine kinase YdfH